MVRPWNTIKNHNVMNALRTDDAGVNSELEARDQKAFHNRAHTHTHTPDVNDLCTGKSFQFLWKLFKCQKTGNNKYNTRREWTHRSEESTKQERER